MRMIGTRKMGNIRAARKMRDMGKTIGPERTDGEMRGREMNLRNPYPDAGMRMKNGTGNEGQNTGAMK